MKWNGKRILLRDASLLLLFSNAQSQGTPPPNFILIFTDDVGFGDLGCYGHPYAKTHHIDRLARKGTMFRQFHVNGNICPVTRSGLMTSRSPAWFPNYPEDYGFLGTLTVTKILQQANYTTGHIGKWNIGPNPSQERVEYGIDYLRVLGGSPFYAQGRERARIDEAMEFIEQNKDGPFYLNLWMMALHTPIDPPQVFIDQFKNLTVHRSDFGFHMQNRFDLLESMGKDIDETMRVYLADLLALDLQVGRLLTKLDELGISKQTVVVFSSDNGPADVIKAPKSLGYAGGLRGGKHTYDEGGTRVPFLVRWPGRVPAGRVDDESVMSALDWLTTVSSLAGAPYPANLVEGEDMSDVWLGATRSRVAPLLFREIATNGSIFIRYGRWKFHHRTRELYDLSSDPIERVNLANTRPDIVAELTRVANEWAATLPKTYVRLPSPATNFNPKEPVQRVTLPNIEDAFPSIFSFPSTLFEAWWSVVLTLMQFVTQALQWLF